MIQGSVSLTDETELNSTIVVKGMHKHTEEWLQRMESRGRVLKKNVINIRGENFFTPKALRAWQAIMKCSFYQPNGTAKNEP